MEKCVQSQSLNFEAIFNSSVLTWLCFRPWQRSDQEPAYWFAVPERNLGGDMKKSYLRWFTVVKFKRQHNIWFSVVGYLQWSWKACARWLIDSKCAFNLGEQMVFGLGWWQTESTVTVLIMEKEAVIVENSKVSYATCCCTAEKSCNFSFSDGFSSVVSQWFQAFPSFSIIICSTFFCFYLCLS